MAKRTPKPPSCLYVPYYRVSTDRQGESGLGLEAQTAIVKRLAASSGCKILEHYTEVESGKDNSRPQLANAIAYARKTGAILVVAKLDRLARDAEFLLNLLNSGLDILFGDFPNVGKDATGRMIISMMAVVAEWEGRVISERTKAALAAYKARGGKLGGEIPACRNLTPEAARRGSKRSSEVQATQARDAYAGIAPVILKLREQGLTLRAIADELNNRGETTRTGACWTEVQVYRTLKRFGPPTGD